MRTIVGAVVALFVVGLAPVPASAEYALPPAPQSSDPFRVISVSGNGRYVLTFNGSSFGTNAMLTDRLAGTSVPVGDAIQISDDGSALLRPDLGWLDLRTGRSLPPPVSGLIAWEQGIVADARDGRVPPKRMSNDGRYVVFTTYGPAVPSSWRWDTTTGAVELVADDTQAIAISGNGRHVLLQRNLRCQFYSAGCPVVVVADMVSGQRQSLLDVMWAASAISDDGRYVLGVLGNVPPFASVPQRIGRLDRLTAAVQDLGPQRGDIQMSNDGIVIAMPVGRAPAAMVLPDTTVRVLGPDAGDSGLILTGDGSAIVNIRFDGVNPDLTRNWSVISSSVRDAGAPRVRAGESVPVTIAGRYAVPADAAAVALNVTVVGMTGSGFVTVYPCGSTVPLASNLNHEAGQTVPNAVVAKLDARGRVCLYTKAGGDLVVDVVGYFPAGTPLTALTPTRLLDTREALGVATNAPLAAGAVVRVQVAGNGDIDARATTAVLNLTATGPAADGFVTVFPCGDAVPTVSNLNYERGRTVANAVVARLDAAGGTCLFTKSSTHLVVDVNGTAAGAGALDGIEPVRLVDTRDTGTPVAAGEALRVRVAGRGAVPAGASAAVLNVTATAPVADGFLTVYPCSATVPTASTVNYVAGQTVANLALARPSADGDVCIFTKVATHVVVDVSGAATGASGFVAIDPVRALDTRILS